MPFHTAFSGTGDISSRSCAAHDTSCGDPSTVPVCARTFKRLEALANRKTLSEEDEGVFKEGREMWLRHKSRERNRKVVQHAKSRFLRKHGRFFCQVCKFDFESRYGQLGAGFIEAHHTVPVSELDPQGSKTRSSDIALVCANCHRMLHIRRPWLTMPELKRLLTNTKKTRN